MLVMHQKSASRQQRRHRQNFLELNKKHLSKRVDDIVVVAKVVSSSGCNNFGRELNVHNIWKMVKDLKILHNHIIRQ